MAAKTATAKTDLSVQEKIDSPGAEILATGTEAITVGFLRKILASIPEDQDDFVVCMSIGPTYEDAVMTDSCLIPDHGSLFLIGEYDDLSDDDKDEEDLDDDVIIGEFVEIPPPEDEFDPNAAEPA